MIMTRDYFNRHARIALEFKLPDGGKFWDYSRLDNVENHIKYMEIERGCTFLQKDYDSFQEDGCVKNFLNTVAYNHKIHQRYREMTFEEVLDLALDAELEI